MCKKNKLVGEMRRHLYLYFSVSTMSSIVSVMLVYADLCGLPNAFEIL